MKPIKLLFMAVVGLTLTANAFAQQGVSEVYGCTFKGGSDMDDLMSARDFYLKQAPKAGLEPPRAFVWTPFKGIVDFDFLWFNQYPDLKTFAEVSDLETTSPEMAAVMERFYSIADCWTSIAAYSSIFDGGEPPVTEPPALIDAYACNFRKGRGEADLEDLWGHIRGVMGGLDSFKDFYLFANRPITKGPNSADVYVAGVNNNVSRWAERTMGMNGSDEGQALMRHVNAVLDCSNTMYYGQRVVPPLE